MPENNSNIIDNTLKGLYDRLGIEKKADFNTFKSDFINYRTAREYVYNKLNLKERVDFKTFEKDLGIKPSRQESINDLKINLETPNYDLKKDGRPKIEAYIYDLINKHGDKQAVEIMKKELCNPSYFLEQENLLIESGDFIEYKFPNSYDRLNGRPYEWYFEKSLSLALFFILAFFIFRICTRLFSNAIQWSIRTLKDLPKQQDTTARPIRSKWRSILSNLFDFSFVNWRKVLAREFLLNLILLVALPILIMGFIVLYN